MLFVRFPLRFLLCFLRPPWGVMFLISGAIAVAILLFGQEYFESLQHESLFVELEKAQIDKKGEIAKKLANCDETGIRLLVQGLASQEEATALACHAALKEQLLIWRDLPNEHAAKLYFVLSQELAKNSKRQNAYALQWSHALAQQAHNDILNRGLEKQRLISENYQAVIKHWQAGQPNPVTAEQLARQPYYHTTLASAGEPRNAHQPGINVPYLVAASTETQATGRIQQLADVESETKPPETLVENSATNDKPVKNQKNETTNPRVGFYSLHNLRPAGSQNESRVLIAKNDQTQQPGREISPFLDGELQMIAANDVAKLPTQDLMKLLNHDHWEISSRAEAVLKNRDEFQDKHIQLAALLYHPQPSIRKTTLSQLIDNEDLETLSWLSELLKDPDSEVRLAAANAICYQIPLDNASLGRLQNLMLSDTNPQVAALARRLETQIANGATSTSHQR